MAIPPSFPIRAKSSGAIICACSTRGRKEEMSIYRVRFSMRSRKNPLARSPIQCVFLKSLLVKKAQLTSGILPLANRLLKIWGWFLEVPQVASGKILGRLYHQHMVHTAYGKVCCLFDMKWTQLTYCCTSRTKSTYEATVNHQNEENRSNIPSLKILTLLIVSLSSACPMIFGRDFPQ